MINSIPVRLIETKPRGNPGAFDIFCENHPLPFSPILISPILQAIAVTACLLMLCSALPWFRNKIASWMDGAWEIGSIFAGTLIILALYPTSISIGADCQEIYYDQVTNKDIAILVAKILFWAAFSCLLAKFDRPHAYGLKNVIACLCTITLVHFYALIPNGIDVLDNLDDFSDYLFRAAIREIEIWSRA